MAYDAELLAIRNARIMEDYKRLRIQKFPIKCGATTNHVTLTYRQILETLKATYCMSIRRLEAVVANANGVTPDELAAQHRAAA